jgi:hypothetical protein
MVRRSNDDKRAECVREDLDMKNEIKQSQVRDTLARVEGGILVVIALLLAGIGFCQHYENYVDAEESRSSIADVQTAPDGADDSAIAVMRPAAAETFEHAKMRVQVSDMAWRDCRYR